MDIRELKTVEEVEALGSLMGEYFTFVCGEIDSLFGIKIEPDAEVRRALTHAQDVLPPRGKSFVVDDDEGPAGMVFIRAADASSHEIKRLYVRPSLRGTGAGRALVETGIAAARSLGSTRLVLDSTPNLAEAIRLYRSLGFKDSEAYEASDHGTNGPLAGHMIFMELLLD